MGLPPLTYNFRSLFVRWSSTLLTTVSIGATVAVIAGVLSLQQGFAALYEEGGRPDVVVFLRPGANAEGESAFQRDRADILIKEIPEIASDEKGFPMASAELYLAVRRFKEDGGETNVPIRGVQPMSFKIAGDRLKIVEGRMFTPGNDEVIVGRSLVGRIRNCLLDDVIPLNTTPFKVVGIFTYDGPFQSEIWGDVDRMGEALERPTFSRVVGKVKSGTDFKALALRMSSDKRVPVKAMSEVEYLSSQTAAMAYVLWFLGAFLGVIMGTAAVFTGTNTMLAALSSRSHEIGILVSIGFRPVAVFFSFLTEALILGLMGGFVGCLLVLPFNGMNTGTTNFQTFTEVAFAFRVTPQVLVLSIGFAIMLGMIGGLIPAWRAATENPVKSLRRL